MEYVKVSLDRWKEITDENRELNERFDALKQGGVVISQWGSYVISESSIDDTIKKKNESMRKTLTEKLETIEEIKSLNYWQFRKWKRKNRKKLEKSFRHMKLTN